MLNWISAYVIFFIGWGCMIAGGLAIAAFLFSCALNYAWRRVRDAYNFAVLCQEIGRLKKEGKFMGFKPEDEHG